MGFIKAIKVAYTKRYPNDNRKPYERFKDWFENDCGMTMTQLDKVAFGLMFEVLPNYIKAMLWATFIGFIFLKIYDKWGIGKLLISVAITLYLKIHFSTFAILHRLKNPPHIS